MFEINVNVHDLLETDLTTFILYITSKTTTTTKRGGKDNLKIVTIPGG